MKNYYPTSLFSKFCVIAVLLAGILIIHSCRKDGKSTSSMPGDVSQAKLWYESAYPSSVSTNGTVVTQSTGGIRDLSKLIKPDWQHATSYVSNNKNVIEIPVDPAAKFISTAKYGKTAFNKIYSRSSYLLVNDGKSYQAYILTIIADSAYVGNDLSKLSHNTYRKQDADFSGLVLYYSPKGDYLGGYAYKNGQVVIPSKTTQQNGGQKTQTVNNGKLTPDDMAIQCTDWYNDYYYDGVFQYSVFLGTTCVGYQTGGGGSSGTGGNGGSGGSSTLPSPPPPPCPPGTSSGPTITPPCIPPASTVESIGGSKLKVDYMPLPGTSNCSVTLPAVPCPVIDTIDNLTDPCLRSVTGKLFKNNLTGKIASILTDVFGSTDKVNLTFVENDGTVPTQTSPISVNGNVYSETITVNLAQVKDASQEYKAIIMVHEVLHAYMNYNAPKMTQLQQHTAMAQKYVNDIKTFVQGLYPTLSDPDAYAMILNGMADVYGNNETAYEAVLATFNTSQANYELQKAGLSGTPCGK